MTRRHTDSVARVLDALTALEAVTNLHRPGEIMAWAEDCADPETHSTMDDPHGGGLLCSDEILGTYCVGCAPEDATDCTDYPWPCPTHQAITTTLRPHGRMTMPNTSIIITDFGDMPIRTAPMDRQRVQHPTLSGHPTLTCSKHGDPWPCELMHASCTPENNTL